MVQPPWINAGEQRLPALSGLVGEDDGAYAIFAQHPTPLGKCSGHSSFVELSILGCSIDVFDLLTLHCFATFGRKCVFCIKRVPQQRVTR